MQNPAVWDLSALYDGVNDSRIETDLQNAEAVVAAFADKWQSRTNYLSDAAVLREALDEFELLQRDTGTGDRAAYFMDLNRAIDQSDDELKAREKQVEKRTIQMENRLRFFKLSLGQVSADEQARLLESPLLAPYRVWLERRFQEGVHDLSVEAANLLELVLPQATDAWSSMIKKLLSQAPEEVYTGHRFERRPFNSLPPMLASPDPLIVDSVGKAMTRVQRRIAPLAAHELNAIVTTKLRVNEFQRYDHPDAHQFQRDGLDADLVEGMLREVEGRFDLAHSFYDLKAHLFGVDSFEYHQRFQAYGDLPDGYSFEEASQMLRQMLAGFDSAFVEEFDATLREGRIDALYRDGKLGGAKCKSRLIEHPVYLLLNFTGALRSLQTLAHEFGHCLNARYMQSGGLCNALTFGVTTPISEATGVFFERPILDAVLERADDEQRLAILVAELNKEVAVIFCQTAAMRFEQELYAQINAEGNLSEERINTLFQKHMSAYLGPRFSMSEVGVWWVYWHHFRLEFYNYSYTFAQLVAKALHMHRATDPSYMDEIRRLLRTGNSQTTRGLLSSMGLELSDGSIWRTGLEQFKAALDEVESLARALGKI